MIGTSALFSQKIAESSRQFRARLLYDGAAISGEIRNITINKGACGESFSIGSIYSPYIEVTLDKCEEILENKELLLQIGLVIDDTVDYIDMGYYTVTKPSRSTYQTTFTAVGRITSKLNCMPTLPAEQTLAKLAAAITEATGVQIICKGVTLAGTIEEDLTGLTCRELLEVITAVLGGFATEDNVGNIVISKFSTADQVAFNGERTIADPEFSDYDYELTGVKVTTTEEWTDEDGTVHPEVSFTEGTPRQTLSMKYMTESLFSAFKANVVGYTYRPGTIPLALGDPRLDPWDCILYTDAKGNAYVVPCLSIVHTFDGGLSTVITAPGESESESESQVKGPLVQKMERIAYQIFTAEQAILRRITADEADLKYATIKTLVATEAKITNLSGEFVSFKEGEFQRLKADQAAFEEATANKFTAVEASITSVLGEFANFKSGEFGTLQADVARIDAAYMDEAAVDSLVVNKGYLTEAQVDTLVTNKGYITELETNHLLADYAKVTELNAVDAKITNLDAKAVTTDNLAAKVGEFGYLKADDLEAEVAEFGYLKANSLESEVAKFGYAKATDLEATNLTVSNLSGEVASFKTATAENFSAVNADIAEVSGDLADYKTVVAGQFSAKDAEIEALEAKDAEIENLVADNLEVTNASIQSLQAEDARIASLFAGYATVDNLSATNANVTNLTTRQANFENATAQNFAAVNASIDNIKADYVKTTELEAESADIRKLFADYATVKSLETTNGNIETLSSTVAEINSAYMDEAKVESLVVGKGYLTEAQVNTLVAGKGYFTEAQVDSLVVGKGYITTAQTNTLLSSYVKTSTLTADYIKASDIASTYATIANLNSTNAAIDNLDATYATIDLANVEAGSINSAMIGDGVVGTAQIADGSITDAKIVGLTANKITAGTLDAGTIEVINLNAANITVGTINGQQIASGAIDTSKLTSSLSSTITTASSNASQALTDASDAQDTADSALSKANTAQTTADGKNTVFYQASAPSTSGRKTNDIWFDTDDGNKMYYWNGSAWTVRQFGTNAIANASITNALIADATIQNAKIANLDAGKITTGTLSADRIGASSITAGKIAADAITTEKIASGAVIADSIASSAITADKIVTSAVTSDKIAANAVTANKILAGSITSDKVATGAITAGKISVDTLSAVSANLGTVTAGVLQSENYQESDYSVSGDGTVTGSVIEGLKIDLNNKAYYTPQITIKDNFIDLNGYMTIGKRIDELGSTDYVIGKHSLSVGLVIADGDFSFAVGANARASGHCSVAFGAGQASGQNSFAVGLFSRASGDGAFAMGTSFASGTYSCAIGLLTNASGGGAFAQGTQTSAVGSDSFAQGRCTEALSSNQHVYGRYNIADSEGVYAHIVGNGTTDKARSNAHTLDWDGNAWYAGDVIAGGTQATDGTVTGGVSLKKSAPRYIVGTGTTAGTWLGTDDSITEYFDGLTVLYKVGIAGASTTTLNINGLGAVQVMRNASSAVTTHYGVNSIVLLTYTTDDGTGYWKIADYDANSYAYVRQYYTTTNGNYPLLSKYDAGITTTTNYVTKYSRYSNKFYINPSTGVLTAPTFKGALDGNATSATKATQDGDGNVITSTYAKASHTHSYLPLAGGTLTGQLLISTGTTQSATKGIKWSAINSKNPYIGYATDQIDGTFLIGSLLGTNYASGLAIGGGSGNLLWKGAKVVTATDLAGYSTTSHTHNYAGASSAGGSATSAVKLDTATAGSATQPAYFTGGKPVACTYTLGKSVPSNAVFTDTVYTHPTTSGNKHIPSGGSSGQFLKWSADGTAVWAADNNTTYSAGTGISLSGTTFSNSGVRSIATGSSNGTISVNTNGTSANVSIKGLGSAAYTASTAYATSSHTHNAIYNDSLNIYINANGHLLPGNTEQQLGTTGVRWKYVCLANSPNVSSDMRLKEDRNSDMSKYVEMLDMIEPKHYLRIDEDVDTRKRHTGYIAQDVWKAMKSVGLKEKDFNGFQKDMQEDGSVYNYGLCYEEFIPILHAKIKQLEKRIEELEELAS